MSDKIRQIQLAELHDIEPAITSTLQVDNAAPTLAWNTTSVVGSVDGVDLTVKMPANPVPSSLKNPNSLTIQGNGTTLTNGTYDGSAAKTVNITPAAIGAAAASHTHSSYANQNAFSNVTVGSTTIAADTTTDTLTLVAGSNVTITPDATNDKITIAATDTKYTHPGYTAKSSGLYKVTVDSTGHVSNTVAVAKADITALGIPESDTNTHYTSKNIVGASATATANAAATNGNVYLNHLEESAVKSSHKIVGSGATTVTSDANGVITISSTDNNTTYSNFVKSGSGAKAGLVPAPSTTAGTTKYLREDGTWQVPPDNNTTYSNFVKSGSGAKAGLVPAPSTTAGTTKYLREDGTWAVPPDTNTTYTLASFGVTATAAELNVLDGITATTAELNYVDGVTSNIQTQLNGKAASSHGTHVSYGTSAAALGTSSAGTATTVSRSDHVHALPALTSCTGTLTVAKGGTGATTAAAARTNLGITPANIGAATSGHTHSNYLANTDTEDFSIAITQEGTSVMDLAANSYYTITAGGASVVFKTPSDNNTMNTVGAGASTEKLYLVGVTSQTSSGGATVSYSNANVHATNGAVVAQSFKAESDRRLKENIKEFKPTKSILDLPIVEFDFKDTGSHQIGCIAQDLQEICPELVSADADTGYLGIQESKIVYLLLDEVKKLKAEVESLKKEN